jgi:hypothetical protein
MVGGIKSDSRAASSRNGGRLRSDFAAQPFENQSNLKRQWRLEPAKARLSPEFMALKAATITTASHQQKDLRQ